MKLAARFRSWLQVTLRRSHMEREMDAELRFHIEAHAEELMRRGVYREEALRQATLEFGALDHAKEACRDARGAGIAESVWRDVGYGVRMLGKSPGFTALAVATLALGIGATTAMFSLVNGVLLRALPYRDPGQLVFLYEPNPRFPGVPLEAFGPFNGDFYDWQKQSRSFTSLALFDNQRLNLAVGGAAVRVHGSRVTGEFFRIFGVAPELGRAVDGDDDQAGRGQVVVISHALWEARFGSDRGVLGRELLLNARPYRIIGVMPAGFAFPHGAESLDAADQGPDVWMPYALTAEERASREEGSGNTIGRLRSDVSLERARAEMSAIVARLDHLHPPMFQGDEAVVRPLDITVTGASRRALLIFMAAVVLLLLIACSNVASLVLARGQGRALEISVRTALGASRFRLVRQLLVEALCLAGVGGILGVVGAFFLIRLVIQIRPGDIPRLEETSLDWRVLLVAVAASLGTALVFGLVPALFASRCNLSEALKGSGGRTVKATSGRVQRGFLVAEVALTFVLLAGAGLLIRSFRNLQSVDRGFAATSTLTMSVQLDERYARAERQTAFFRSLMDRASVLPGVEATAAISHLPLGGGESVSTLRVEGHPFEPKTLYEDRAVSPRYFAAMGIPVLSGRVFTDDDVSGRPPVVIVSRSFARRYFPGQHAVGKRINYGNNRQLPWWTIVGVVADVRQLSLESAPPMQVYQSMWQTGSRSASVVMRTGLAADTMAANLRALVRNIDPAVAVADVSTMSQVLSKATSGRRFQTLLMAAFGNAALFLSLVGLYGSMAWRVQQRTAEIGVRMALGAQRSSVLFMVLKQGCTLALAGIALGAACAWGMTRWIASLLFEVNPTDAATFLGVAIFFGVVALAACYVPARRATSVEPTIALRYE